MKKLLLAPLFVSLVCCAQPQLTQQDFANTIDAAELRVLLYTYASDEFEGRETGTAGEEKAVQFLRDQYKAMGIASGTKDGTYFQPMTLDVRGKNVASKNVLAFIEGSEKPEEILVISAHLDHEGVKNGKIYNGADDDGSGTVAILEIAEAFQLAVASGQGPKRSILFLHVSGEEKGLLGSKYYTDNPVYSLENTVANLNIDMVGRTDPKRKGDRDYIYLIGSDKLSQDLHDLSEEANQKFTNLTLDYTFNADDDPNRFYYRSDHYNFAKNNIPVIFYFNAFDTRTTCIFGYRNRISACLCVNMNRIGIGACIVFRITHITIAKIPQPLIATNR